MLPGINGRTDGKNPDIIIVEFISGVKHMDLLL